MTTALALPVEPLRYTYAFTETQPILLPDCVDGSVLVVQVAQVGNGLVEVWVSDAKSHQHICEQGGDRA